ncbi:glycosyltransferase family 2 protein [uncultured Winogradskyella sp.]|uniref:glycosyltransferase family 2 protein n=1 Tax=uncultured Winogradskyella sp. TaxID=395353 RepID=UPI002610153B|nr:glycosyltransferase family 2 protein [uncultured Winogradskyella sp.]
MSSPLVTILLPVYNGEKTIKTTIESLLNQTFTNFELLLGIDGTTDASKNIALAFNDSRIRVIEHPQNLGLANNLNAIIRHASSNSHYFAMAEQDDIYVPERLEWQVEVMNKYADVGLVSGIAEFKSDNKVLQFPGILVNNRQFPQGEELFKYLYVNQLKVVNTCMMWRKYIHAEHDLIFNNTYGNFNVDWDFVLRFSLLSKIHGISKKLVTMNRLEQRDSVTQQKHEQYNASRNLLKDFHATFPNIVSKKLYQKALNMHRKIEIGNNPKYKIVLKSIAYYLMTFDRFYIDYLFKKVKFYTKSRS